MNTCYLLSWGEEGRVYLSCWPGSAIVAVLQDGDSATSLTSGTDCCCCCWCSRCRYLYSNDKKGKDTYPVLLLWRHGPNCASFPLCSIDVSAVDSTQDSTVCRRCQFLEWRTDVGELEISNMFRLEQLLHWSCFRQWQRWHQLFNFMEWVVSFCSRSTLKEE